MKVYYSFYVNVYHWIDLLLYSYIPFLVMLICTIIIIYRLVRINNRLSRNSLTATTANQKTPHEKPRASHHRHNGSIDHRAAKLNLDMLQHQPPSSTASILAVSVSANCSSSDKHPAESAMYVAAAPSPPSMPSLGSPLKSPPEQSVALIQLRPASIVNDRVSSATGCMKKDASTSTFGTSGLSGTGEIAKKRAKKNSQIYKLLLTLNVFFFVLVTPLVLCNSLGLLNSELGIKTEFVYILAYSNHSLNFFFYGLSCEMYRNVLFDTFRSCFRLTKLTGNRLSL